ncbi:MAG: glycosyltransferase [Sphingomonas bacterium]|nr:glycosyltransferase [Sphingomonas bacterium]
MTAHLLMTADAVGGVWHYATDLARGLTRHGWRTTIAVMGPGPSAAQRAAAETIPGLALVETGQPLDWMIEDEPTTLAAAEALAALARELRVDLIQLNAPGLAAAAKFPAPIVAVTHSCVATWFAAVRGGALPADFVWRAMLTGVGLATADRAVAPSAALADATVDAYGLKRRPLVVHNGRAPLTRPAAAMHDFCFTAGRLWDKAKNVTTLDRIAGRLAVPFRAAGPLHGPNSEVAPEMAHLHTLGPIEEAQIGRWLASRPLFVSAALYEPFGLAVLEAAAAGCPLILSDIPTFRELWDGAATFIAAKDDQGFAIAAETIIGDGGLRLSLGDAARQRASRYTPAAMAANMAQIYRDIGIAPAVATGGGEAAT